MFVARDCPLGQGESRPHHWPLLRPSASYVGFQYLSTLTVCGGIACRGSKKPPGEIEMFNAVRFTQKIAIQTFQAYSLLLITLSSAALTGCSGLVTANNSGGGTPPPLTISGVQAATPTTGGFQVSWSTNVAANSVVDYGTTANYGSSTPANSAMVTSHQVAVTGLTPGTLYHFRVRSTDASNSSISSADMTFSTAARGGVKIGTAPGISFQDSGLSASTSYTYNVSAFDAAGNTSAQSAGASATTQAVSGGPVISGVSVGGITTSSATVTWTTDVAATSQVEYGTTTAYGNLTTLNSSLVTSHTTLLVSLATNTLFHYRVHSKNSSGVESIGGDFAFQTSSVVDTTPPTISITAPTNGATVSGTMSVSANASDNVGVASVQFTLDGSNLGSALTASPYQVAWDTTTATNGAHVLGAAARDAAGNVGNAVPVTVTVSNSTTSTPEADFQARCAAAGVLVCTGWDNASDFTPASGGGGYADGLYPASDGTYQGTMDTTIKTSGAGSLKFTIRAGSVHPFAPLPAGQWLANFGPSGCGTGGVPCPHSFGANSTLYLQFRMRVDDPMLTFNWTTVSDTGWKTFIVFGPIPGPSCTNTQFVQENSYQHNIFFGYTSCGTPALVTNGGNTPYNYQQGAYSCLYGTNTLTDPTCFRYVSNTWITEYWKVTIGSLGTASTHFEAWAGFPGQALQKFIDLPNFTFSTLAGGSAGEGLQEILLTPYWSGASASTTTPAATMWFDELIISTQPIAAPKF